MTIAEPKSTPLRHDRFVNFLAAMTRLVGQREGDEAAILRGAGPALRELVSHDDWLDDRFAQPDANQYRQYLLYCDPLNRFSVVSFVWEPGQETPVHNHTIWGLVGVLRGAEQNQRFILVDSTPQPGPIEVVEAGNVVELSPTIGDIHKVTNVSSSTAVSIHVYGANIGMVQRQAFMPDGAIRDFVSGYSSDVLPNFWTPS